MAYETIGSPSGNLNKDREWSFFVMDATVAYLRHVCGPEPPGCEIAVKYFEHDLGEYADIVLWHDGDLPMGYFNKCIAARCALEDHVSWSEIEPAALQDTFDDIEQEAWENENAFSDDETNFYIVKRFAATLTNSVKECLEVPPEAKEILQSLHEAIDRLPRPTRGIDMALHVSTAPAQTFRVKLTESEFHVASSGYTQSGAASDSYEDFDFGVQVSGLSWCEGGEPFYDEDVPELMNLCQAIGVSSDGEEVLNWKAEPAAEQPVPSLAGPDLNQAAAGPQLDLFH